MKEIELKFEIENYNEIRSRIEKVDAEYKGNYRQIDLWLDTKDWRLRHEGKGLRIRRQNSSTVLTLKDKQAYAEVREAEELEVRIDNFEKTFEIFKRSGFLVDMEIDKEREVWKHGGVEVCLDKVKDLGTFLELEGPREDIERVIKELKLENLPRITKHYGQLIEERNIKV